jgi:phosphatidate phosphatase APP1
MPDRNAIARTPQPDARPGWKLRLEDRLGLLDPIQLVVYRSFGTGDALHIRGRVVERKAIEGTTEETPTWRNILNTWHRLESDEIPGATIRARIGGRSWETTSDGEGYFVFDLDPAEPFGPGWHDVRLELVSTPVGVAAQRTVPVPVLVPAADAEFAVVSDIDDTVIRSRATQLIEQIAILFRKGAGTRTPFAGVPALYRALARGPDDRGVNPIFYVSRSGWNLYDLFDEFLDLHGIPAGPLFLSDLRIIEDASTVVSGRHHKFESIDMLVRTYPELPFVLIGDSGQEDPELYRQITRAHAGRVRAIYIHDVSADDRDEEVDRIADELRAAGVPFARVADSGAAARHAADIGIISADGLADVERAMADHSAAAHDSGAPPG